MLLKLYFKNVLTIRNVHQSIYRYSNSIFKIGFTILQEEINKQKNIDRKINEQAQINDVHSCFSCVLGICGFIILFSLCLCIFDFYKKK